MYVYLNVLDSTRAPDMCTNPTWTSGVFLFPLHQMILSLSDSKHFQLVEKLCIEIFFVSLFNLVESSGRIIL